MDIPNARTTGRYQHMWWRSRNSRAKISTTLISRMINPAINVGGHCNSEQVDEGGERQRHLLCMFDWICWRLVRGNDVQKGGKC